MAKSRQPRRSPEPEPPRALPPARPRAGAAVEKRAPQRFDPTALARSTIAPPLLELIEAERAASERVLSDHPELLARHNTAIFLNRTHPGGAEAALAAVRRLIADRPKRPRSKPESIEAPDPAISPWVCFARLDAATIRHLRRLSPQQLLPPIERIWPSSFDVIIDINLAFAGAPQPTQDPDAAAPASEFEHPDPRRVAKALICTYIDQALKRSKSTDGGVDAYKTQLSSQYVLAHLSGAAIQELVRIDLAEARTLRDKAARATRSAARQAVGAASEALDTAVHDAPALELSAFRTIHHIWPDFEVRSCITQSIRTVKVDAAQRSFTASGQGITWGVMDTGIDALHPHFKLHANIDPASPLHGDFTDAPDGPEPLRDAYGHGTHVAGIIAGGQDGSDTSHLDAVWQEIDENQRRVTRRSRLGPVSGMAPQCKLVSLKVLDEFGIGKASNVIAAISHVQLLNGHGRDLKIHGVNLSLGHAFDPKWFACGHSPLCVEVNRLVKSGVVVVVAAGNTGYGTLQTKEGSTDTALDLTINDPGNAECAITVGATHRDMPHRYGVSYFSSKGPTGDGRVKPDLVAPGERIVSCAAAGSTLVEQAVAGEACAYFENSGTSMAAPHVSGAIAAFLSIRREFIGEAEKVKAVFTSTATDLGRDRYFQGHGLIDLMRAIQSV